MAAALQSNVSLIRSMDSSSSLVSSAGFASYSGLRSAGVVTQVAVPRRAVNRRFLSVKAAAATVTTQFTTLKPLADRILVKISQVEEKTLGGILLPTAAQTKPQGGEVVAVGEGRSVGEKKIPVAIEVGSSIVYSKYAGTEVEFKDAEHLLLKEDDVVGLLATDDIKDLKPLNDRVLIKVLEAEGKTAGGVLLTESAKEKPVIGEVFAVGPGSLGEDGERKPLEVAAGNNVLYSKYAGQEFKSKDGTQFVVMRSNDVMAILS